MGRSRSKGKDRLDRDAYVTPTWCVEGLAKAVEESLPTPDWVVDLGAGDGRIGLAVRERMRRMWITVEVEKGSSLSVPHPRLLLVESDASYQGAFQKRLHHRDGFFLQPLEQCGDQVDRLLGESRVLYVANPPFSLAFDWVRRAVEMLGGRHAPGSAAIFLLRADWLATKRRAEFVERCPPDRIDLLVPRPSFTGGGTDMREYMWAWWASGFYRGTQIKVMRKERKEG